MSKRPLKLSSSLKPVPGIKHIIAVGSGKGGVGKSTVSLNIALALRELNLQCGLLDADIYGPNQAHMCQQKTRATVSNNQFEPVMAHGLQTMSMSYLVDDETPMVWRGPMVTKMLHQMLFFTHWKNLDTLIIDLPPGTGDVPLTLAKKAPIDGAVIVTTPQNLATADAEKGINMFKKVDIPVLGIIENMSIHTCRKCGHQDTIFGTDGAQQLATKTSSALLGQLPLDTAIREASDSGRPIILSNPSHPASKTLLQVAKQIKKSLKNNSNSTSFPDIIVE